MKCHHPTQERSSPGTRKVITRHKKGHHPAQERSSPGTRKVITRLVRVIQMHKPESKCLYEGVIAGLPEQVGQ
jgi:hypothetical protein